MTDDFAEEIIIESRLKEEALSEIIFNALDTLRSAESEYEEAVLKALIESTLNKLVPPKQKSGEVLSFKPRTPSK